MPVTLSGAPIYAPAVSLHITTSPAPRRLAVCGIIDYRKTCAGVERKLVAALESIHGLFAHQQNRDLSAGRARLRPDADAAEIIEGRVAPLPVLRKVTSPDPPR